MTPLIVRAALLLVLTGLAACGGGSGSDTPANAPPQSPAAASNSVHANAQSAAASSNPQQGVATFYPATGDGACLFGTTNDHGVTAVNPSSYAGSAACGTLLNVTGPKGTVTVRVVDLCPACTADQLDLSAEAFAQIAEPSAGRVSITWQTTEGTQTDPVQYRYKEGSSRYWVAIQVRNNRLRVTQLEIQPDASGTWVTVPRTDYNYFVYPQTIAAGELPVRITSSTGSQLVDRLPAPQSGLIHTGQAQFP